MGSTVTMDNVGKRKVQGQLVHKDCSLTKTIIQTLGLIFLKISGRAARLEHFWMCHPWKNFLILLGIKPWVIQPEHHTWYTTLAPSQVI